MSNGGFRPNSGRKKGSVPWNKGVPMSEESKKKVSLSKQGSKAWNKGIPMTRETREKLIASKTGKSIWPNGRVFSKEHRKKMSLAKLGKPSGRKGIPMSQEQKDKLRLANLGKKQTSQSREKNRQGQYRRHAKNNPDYVPDGWLDLRKKRIKAAGKFHSEVEWREIKEKFNFTCPSCKKSEPQIRLTRDHIIAISKGGHDGKENIQPLCHSCNSRKNTKTIRY